jgi:hypothetical protein
MRVQIGLISCGIANGLLTMLLLHVYASRSYGIVGLYLESSLITRAAVCVSAISLLIKLVLQLPKKWQRVLDRTVLLLVLVSALWKLAYLFGILAECTSQV